ncbi:hypothetical protein OF83DRAFT_1176167 [Amylostereum chailletii]|nr:hypothetical protein OF83DRAFT_1176167 [Amylostereum chailletii]
MTSTDPTAQGEHQPESSSGQDRSMLSVGSLGGSSLMPIFVQRLAEYDSALATRRVDVDLQSQLEQEVEQVSRIVYDLKVRRNACRPFVRLPTEIIAIIVSFVSHVNTSRTYGHARYILFRQILRLSHICHHIREVVLGMSALWAMHIFTSRAAYRTVLERARRAPLHIAVDTDWRETIVSAALPLLERARAVHVQFSSNFKGNEAPLTADADGESDGNGKSLRAWIKRLAGRTSPSLNSLIMDSHRQGFWGSSIIDVPPLIAPKLHTLSFRNAFIPWTSSSLRKLSMSFRACDGGDIQFKLPYSSAQFVALLESHPTIKRLSLRNCLPDMSDILRHEARRPIPLPRLSSVKLEGSLARCFSFWKCLDFPPTKMHIQIKIKGSKLSEGDMVHTADNELLPRFFQLLTRHICGTQLAPRRSHAVSYVDFMSWLTISTSFIAVDPSSRNPVDQSDAGSCDITKLDFEWKKDENDVFAMAADAFSFQDVEIVKIHLVVYTLEKWQNMLSRLSGTRELHLFSPFENLISAITLSSPLDDSSAHLLPVLASLRLWSWDGRSCKSESLLAMLSSRKDAGIGLQHVTLDCASGWMLIRAKAEETQLEIQKLVTNLVWGGGKAKWELQPKYVF